MDSPTAFWTGEVRGIDRMYDGSTWLTILADSGAIASVGCREHGEHKIVIGDAVRWSGDGPVYWTEAALPDGRKQIRGERLERVL
jgi:hypothetical protein